MGYASLIISLLALLASAYSVFEARRHNRISQKPFLVANEREAETEYVYEIVNKGGGPAFFTCVEYYFNLEIVDGKTLREKLRKHLSEKGVRFRSTFTILGQETVMAPGEKIEILHLNIHQEDIEKMADIRSSVYGIRIDYKSGHGDSSVWFSDERLRNI